MPNKYPASCIAKKYIILYIYICVYECMYVSYIYIHISTIMEESFFIVSCVFQDL